jgi:uncharacterized ubiquitin-like protein YukD
MAKNDGPGGHNQITVKVIVNGTPTDVKTNVHAPFKSVIEKALEQTGNTGRPIEDWELKFNGQVLDLNKKVEDYNIPDGAELFFSLRAGQGGSN